MEKTCASCKQVKAVTCFSKNSKRRDGLQTYCKQCSSLTSKSYYLTHTEKHKKTTRIRKHERRIELKKQINELKSQLGCATCDENDSCCLDFHHFDSDSKDFEIAIAPSNGWQWEKVLTEIKKCVCLCANCHRKAHNGKIIISKDMIYSPTRHQSS